MINETRGIIAKRHYSLFPGSPVVRKNQEIKFYRVALFLRDFCDENVLKKRREKKKSEGEEDEWKKHRFYKGNKASAFYSSDIELR